MEETPVSSFKCRELARICHISQQKARRLLINAGSFSSERSEEIHDMLEQGMTVTEIAQTLKLSISCVWSYMPYVRCEYKRDDCSENAKKIRKWRKRKAAESSSTTIPDANRTL